MHFKKCFGIKQLRGRGGYKKGKKGCGNCNGKGKGKHIHIFEGRRSGKHGMGKERGMEK